VREIYGVSEDEFDDQAEVAVSPKMPAGLPQGGLALA
jgi:hypothetical protein